MKFKSFRYFYPEAPTLIHRDSELVDKFSADSQWVAEPKYNGCRLMLHIIDGDVQFWDRHGKQLKYNDHPAKTIIERLKMLFPKGYYLFDGELRNNKVTGIRDKMVLWDCFIWDGEFLNHVPYALRRLRIEGFLVSGDEYDISLIKQYPGDFKQVFENYILGLHGNPEEFEGIVMKNLNGMLNLSPTKNNESSWMFKIRKETGRHKF
jgi:ATP-dependent DNA ligase